MSRRRLLLRYKEADICRKDKIAGIGGSSKFDLLDGFTGRSTSLTFDMIRIPLKTTGYRRRPITHLRLTPEGTSWGRGCPTQDSTWGSSSRMEPASGELNH